LRTSLSNCLRQLACLRVVALRRFPCGALDRLAEGADPEGGRELPELVKLGGEFGRAHKSGS
jgi:hypothetical protein